MCTALGSMPRSGHGTTSPLPLAASTRLRACCPSLPPGQNVNVQYVVGNATVVLPVSNGERNCLCLCRCPRLLRRGRGCHKCKCSRSQPRESRKSRAHISLIFRSRNLEAGKHAKTTCDYAAAPFHSGFETEGANTQKTSSSRLLPPAGIASCDCPSLLTFWPSVRFLFLVD